MGTRYVAGDAMEHCKLLATKDRSILQQRAGSTQTWQTICSGIAHCSSNALQGFMNLGLYTNPPLSGSLAGSALSECRSSDRDRAVGCRYVQRRETIFKPLDSLVTAESKALHISISIEASGASAMPLVSDAPATDLRADATFSSDQCPSRSR